ncbi:MAG: prepilin-type N-terminal cleavage/methylation domain-containing protein [Rhodoferax sp.]|nr:prepilin-type N-terminal cleavage/methylation domain-containing protein [Rhodoferax sp.]
MAIMRSPRGFTLIELLVVLAALAALLAIAAPRYFQHVDRSREVVLRHNLAAMREAIDKFHADRSRYPSGLQELVNERYLRALPLDPLTERADSWLPLGPNGQPATAVMSDVRSGAPGLARDGTSYADW